MDNIKEQMERQAELKARRAAWDQEHARKKEQERLQQARDELESEKQRRLTFWMENGGSPEDFDRAWPSIQREILEEQYNAQRYERLARAEDLFA
jgi:hypothetical protein